MDAVIESLNDVFFELRGARILRHNSVTEIVWVIAIRQAKYVHLYARGNERNDGMHVLGNARRRVKGDRSPHRIEVLLRDAARFEKLARAVRTVHLEAVYGATVIWHQPKIMEHRASVEEFCIDLEVTLFARERSEKVNTAGMV